jgi:plasmid maintenance system antidote protein VapI
VGGGYTSAQLSFIKSIDNFNDAQANFMNSDANAITAVLNYSTAATPTQANAVRAFLNNSNSMWMMMQSPENQVSIFSYLIQNNFSNQSVAFINQCITRMKADPIFTSIKPFLIEKGIDDSALDACTKGILNKLKNLQQIDIAKMLAKLDNTTIVHKPNYNTTISSQNQINSTNSNVYAQTNFDVSPPFPSNIQSPFNYHIDISPSYLDGSLLTTNTTPPKKPTELSIARTLLHEIIHAYFDSLYDDCYYNNNCTTIKQFPDLWSDYEHHYLQLPNTTIVTDPQHLTIANNFVKVLASALQEYQTGVPLANNAEPNQDYKDLAWQGLYGKYINSIPDAMAQIFNLEYPIGSDKKIRFDRINAAEDIQLSSNTNGTQIAPKSTPCN